MKNTPHFILFSRTVEQTTENGLHGGSWFFRLESRDGEFSLEAHDFEQGTSYERLELLAVVRGLEALDQPSAVTLVTSSRQVSRRTTGSRVLAKSRLEVGAIWTKGADEERRPLEAD